MLNFRFQSKWSGGVRKRKRFIFKHVGSPENANANANILSQTKNGLVKLCIFIFTDSYISLNFAGF